MQKVFTIAGIIVVVVVVIGVILAQWRRGYETMTAAEVHDAIAKDSSMVLLDVRTTEEFHGESGHIAKALLMPVEDLERRIQDLEQFKSRTIVVYCRSGRRSANAAGLLTGRGFTAVNLEGGILRWRELGYPVIQESGNEQPWNTDSQRTSRSDTTRL